MGWAMGHATDPEDQLDLAGSRHIDLQREAHDGVEHAPAGPGAGLFQNPERSGATRVTVPAQKPLSVGLPGREPGGVEWIGHRVSEKERRLLG